MINMYEHTTRLRMLVSAVVVGLAASLAWTATGRAADCPRKGTLGTSRILAIDAATYPRVGLKNFPQTLPLRDHEVVLTFDDGPWPPTTPKVLGMDLWAGDWNKMTPKQELKLLIDRLRAARKGIILLHDPKAQTAAMLPAFLRYLRDHDYHVVHVVPGTAGIDFDGAP